MRGPTFFILCLLLALLAVSTSGYRYFHQQEHNSLGVPGLHGKGHSHGHHGSRHDAHIIRREVDDDGLKSHLAYIQDTVGVDVDRTKAQQLAKQRNKKRRRYN
ncbi:hypothetical protein TSMEX_006869 [Taenia solium]|eukprot:TsM_000409500 transcript=TsM_000409500 gene=TsM_000409500